MKQEIVVMRKRRMKMTWAQWVSAVKAAVKKVGVVRKPARVPIVLVPVAATKWIYCNSNKPACYL